MHKIMAVKVNGRIANAPHVQGVLTKYGCNIKTRVGFHEINEDKCSMDGIIILELLGPDKEDLSLYNDLKVLDGVVPKIIEF